MQYESMPGYGNYTQKLYQTLEGNRLMTQQTLPGAQRKLLSYRPREDDYFEKWRHQDMLTKSQDAAMTKIYGASVAATMEYVSMSSSNMTKYTAYDGRVVAFEHDTADRVTKKIGNFQAQDANKRVTKATFYNAKAIGGHNRMALT
jgi:hypothetical protein